MSLSGNARNTGLIMDEALEHEKPNVPDIDINIYALPGHLRPQFHEDFKSHTTDISKHPGGAAGQGPAPPEPPTMDTQDEPTISIPDEDGGEVVGDEEETTDKIMMFAKMDVPGQYLNPSQQG